MNTNQNNKPQALTPDQVKAREAALAAAKADQPKPATPTVAPVTVDHKPVTPQVAPLPGMTPLGVKPVTGDASKPTDKALPVAPVTTAPAEKPISDLVKAATTALANTDNKAAADKAVAALASAANLPVNPVKVASTEPATAKAHAAAIAKANANVGKPQGGTVAKAKGKVDKAKPETKVTAAKPAKQTPREAALANDKLVRGYDFSKWPKAMLAIMPTVDIIDAVRATGVLKTYITKTELALCVYCMPEAQRFNVYDVATALQNVCGGSHDHKMNTVNQKAVPSKQWVRINQGARAQGLTDGKALIAYGVAPSTQGLTKIKAVLGDRTPKHWLPETGPSKASDKGKGVTATTPANA